MYNILPSFCHICQDLRRYCHFWQNLARFRHSSIISVFQYLLVRKILSRDKERKVGKLVFNNVIRKLLKWKSFGLKNVTARGSWRHPCLVHWLLIRNLLMLSVDFYVYYFFFSFLTLVHNFGIVVYLTWLLFEIGYRQTRSTLVPA